MVCVSLVRNAPLGRAALERMASAHRDPPHPTIAPTLELVHDESGPVVVLDVPGCIDLDGLLRISADAHVRATHAEADGFIVTLRDALLTTAREPGRDPSNRHIGTLGFGNVIFAPDGRFFLVGLGHNVAIHDELGCVVARSRFFQAPEIAVRGEATERSDFVAVLMLLRSMMAFVDLDGSIVRAISGNSITEDVELVKLLLSIERNTVHANPSRRATIEQTIRASNRIRELIGVSPDASGFIRRIAGILAPEFPTACGEGDECEDALLRVEPSGAWFDRNSGPRIDLARRSVLSRMLVVLARQRIERPGQALDVTALCSACWPGERVLPSAAANRVYVAVNGLRRVGLGAHLERTLDGYRIDPSVACSFTEL